MSLIICEINLILNWSDNFVISNSVANLATTSAITDTKFYVWVVTLSAQGNAKLLQPLKSGFKRTINRNKYQSETAIQNAKNKYLDNLIDPSFQGVNRSFL